MSDSLTIGALALAAAGLFLSVLFSEVVKDTYGVLKRAIFRRFRRSARPLEGQRTSPRGEDPAPDPPRLDTMQFDTYMQRRVADASERERLRTRWIVELLAAVFVDAMRMFYVGASATARAVNEARYEQFRKMAEHHLSELDRQVERFSADLDPKILAGIRTLEPPLRWIIKELAGGPCAFDGSDRYLRHLMETAENLSQLCLDAGIEHYPQTKVTIDSLVHQLWSSSAAEGMADLDRLFVLRLKAQSEFLHQTQRHQRWPLLTIADDLKQTLALAYFLIDLELLQRVRA